MLLKELGEEATYYYHPDHLGSVSVVSNHRGEPYERVEYLPFGEIWIEETDPATGYIPFRFTSKELDEETGLYYYGARYYEPTTSRWMSPDPAGFGLINPMGSDGELRANYSVIEALNWYAYVSNNPVKYVDPTGMEEENTDASSEPPKPDGYNVYSTVDGTYKGGQWDDPEDHAEGGLGYYASVLDDEGNWHNYGHLDKDSVENNGLKKGDRVEEEDYLGKISEDENEDGHSTGPHVHHEAIEKDEKGRWVNDKREHNYIDPGEKDPLGGTGKQTAGYPKYENGTFHGGRDFAPKEEFKH